ncbi:MAG TPA: LON peptidase substrate-binding domain-containing protein [Thermoanaerobaculaceae bacterium]|nr:LON peptidase substrate-binding domain-containing protein [Thermoanaerobaculaceae bacterium]HRS17681.1 LON peptidase substrate-binding domain-containing protein [Thermoanaerobaculaceae bacterium]
MRLPLFPLPIAVLPGEVVPLHIFEERYKAMLGRVRQGGADGRPLPFAIAYHSGEAVAVIACKMRLQRVLEEYGDGRMDVLTVGEERVQIHEVFDDLPYFEAVVEPFMDEDEVLDTALGERLLALATRLGELQTGKPVFVPAAGEAPLSFRVALLIDMAPEERQLLLQTTSENLRRTILADHIAGLVTDFAAEGVIPELVN